jgi:hypothetical protein
MEIVPRLFSRNFLQNAHKMRLYTRPVENTCSCPEGQRSGHVMMRLSSWRLIRPVSPIFGHVTWPMAPSPYTKWRRRLPCHHGGVRVTLTHYVSSKHCDKRRINLLLHDNPPHFYRILLFFKPHFICNLYICQVQGFRLTQHWFEYFIQ